MTLEAWGVFAEIVGGISVLVTLIYLAIQVRQNTKQLKFQALKDAIGEFLTVHNDATNDVTKANLYRRGLGSFSTLSADEKAVFHSQIHPHLSGFHQVMILHKDGLIDLETFLALERVFLKTWLCPGAREWWSQYEHVPPPFLVNHIAKRMQEVSSSMNPFSQDIDWYKSD